MTKSCDTCKWKTPNHGCWVGWCVDYVKWEPKQCDLFFNNVKKVDIDKIGIVGELAMVNGAFSVWDGQRWCSLVDFIEKEVEEILVENVCNLELPDELFEL